MKVVLLLVCYVIVLSDGFTEFNQDYDDDEEVVIFNYNQYLQKPHSTRVDSKSKVETLGNILKGKLKQLKER
jgi:hypothetical protein